MAGEGFDQFLDVGIVAFHTAFEFSELRQDLSIRSQRFAHAHEGAYDEDAHFDSAVGVENGRSHQGAGLGEDVRQGTAAAVART